MRILRRVVVVAGFVLGTMGLALVALLAALHTDPGRAVVRERLQHLLSTALAGRVTLGALETPRPGTIVLRDVVASMPERGVVRASRIELALGLPLPVPPTLRLRHVRVDGLVAHLRDVGPARDRDDRDGGGITVAADDLRITAGRLAMRLDADVGERRVVLSPISLRASLSAGPAGLRLAVASLEATPRGLPLAPIDAALTLRVAADGGIELPSFALTSSGTRLSGTGTLDASRVVDAHLSADPLAPAALAPLVPGLVLPPGSTARLALRGSPAGLRASAQVDLGAAGRIAARARVDASGELPVYRATLAVQELVPGALSTDWPREPLAARVRADGRGRVLRARGRLATPGVEVAWTGDAGFGDSAFARLDASGQVRDLARFAGGTAGRFPFQVQAEASGALPRPAHARATFTLGSGTLAGRQLARGSAQARLEGTRLQVHELQVEADGMRVGGDARADLDRRSLDASLELLLAGRGRAAGTVSLARTRAGWEGHVRGLTLAPEALPAWTSDGAATLAFRDGMRLDGLRLRSGAQRADLSLAVRADGALTGTLAVSALQLAPLCTVAGTTCGGVATGRLQAAGSTTAPRLSLGASAHDVAVGPLARSSIDAAIHWEAGRAAGRVTVAGLGGSVVVSGSVPAPIGRPPVARDALDLRITARDLAITRLAAWRPQIVRAATGTIRGDLHLGGTWDAPRPDGTLRLRAAALELVASGARWEDVVVALRADGARGLVIERLTAAGGSGTLQGSGRFDFVRGAVPTVDVRLELERFLAVDRPVLEASVDGRLRVTGPLTGPTVRGRLYVPDGTVRPAFLPAANAPLEPDPTIEVVGLPGTEAAPPPPSMGELALGVTITLGDGMRIRRRDANVQLGGTLHVERTPPGPLTVRGTVEIERGWYTFSGRRFTMRSGEVRFTGGPVDTAVLDLEATHRTTEYDVTVAVQGTIGTPELLLSSDPPLDETDVLAVLLVGRPSGELSDSERLSVQAEAASLAVGYVVPGLGGGLGDALPLDEVQVGLEQVRVGQHVGSDVFISLSQQFSGWAGQTMAVEYTITRRLSVELSTSSRGSGAIDFFWRRRY